MLQIVLLTIFASSVGVVCAGGGLGGGGRFVYDLDWFEGSEDGSSLLEEAESLLHDSNGFSTRRSDYSRLVEEESLSRLETCLSADRHRRKLESYVSACSHSCQGTEEEEDRFRCVTRCVSPVCYYKTMEEPASRGEAPEEGQLDLRLPEFAACFYSSLCR